MKNLYRLFIKNSDFFQIYLISNLFNIEGNPIEFKFIFIFEFVSTKIKHYGSPNVFGFAGGKNG